MKFLVRDLDARMLTRMRKDAEHARVPLAEYIRQILCSHFDLECMPSRAQPRESKGATTIRLRMQPELHQAVKDESQHTGQSMQMLIREALEAHYQAVT